jgi:probable HAF family extracellular repeat protein
MRAQLVRLSVFVFTVVTIACQDPEASALAPVAPGAEAESNVLGYVPIDLGTLGGDSTVPFALNDSGHVVGYSTNAQGEHLAFLWRDGVMTNLGTLVGGATEAHAISNSGLIAGISSVEPYYPEFEMAVVAWRDGAIRRLDPSTYIGTIVKDITDDGTILADLNYGDTYRANRGFVWHNDVPTDVGGFRTRPYTLPATWNRRAQVVGKSWAYERGFANDYFHPFVWDAERGFRGLSVGERTPCEPNDARPCGWGTSNDVNDAGLIVGYATDTTLTTRAVYWDEDGRHDLGVYPGEYTSAVAINNRGEIIGVRQPTRHADFAGSFIWSRGTLTELPPLDGEPTIATAINERGDVIGYRSAGYRLERAFIWANGIMTDLTRPGELGFPVAINARGDVLARVRVGSGPTRGVLWRRDAPAVVASEPND